MTQDIDTDETPMDHAHERREALLEDQAELEDAQQRVGKLEARANKELTPLSLLVDWLEDQVDELQSDPFLDEQAKADKLRDPPSLEQQAGVHTALDFTGVAIEDLSGYKQALAEVFPGLDFAGSKASTLPQIQDVLEDHLAGRRTFWQDRAKKAAEEVQSLQQGINSEREKLESFCRTHELPVDEIVPDRDESPSVDAATLNGEEAVDELELEAEA